MIGVASSRHREKKARRPSQEKPVWVWNLLGLTEQAWSLVVAETSGHNEADLVAGKPWV